MASCRVIGRMHPSGPMALEVDYSIYTYYYICVICFSPLDDYELIVSHVFHPKTGELEQTELSMPEQIQRKDLWRSKLRGNFPIATSLHYWKIKCDACNKMVSNEIRIGKFPDGNCFGECGIDILSSTRCPECVKVPKGRRKILKQVSFLLLNTFS